MRFRGSGSAHSHADPLVPRQRSDYTKGMRDNYKGEDLTLAEFTPTIPPGWDSDDNRPEAATFKDYCTRLSRWLMITTLQADQQCHPASLQAQRTCMDYRRPIYRSTADSG